MKAEKSTVDGFISTFNGNLDSLAEHLQIVQAANDQGSLQLSELQISVGSSVNAYHLSPHLAYRQYFVVVFGELESIVRVLIDTTFLSYRVLKPFERRD